MIILSNYLYLLIIIYLLTALNCFINLLESCRCKAIGSYGKLCDPETRQCTCKPGVGGLRCDRCEANYWGLNRIAEGNTGCLRELKL